MIFKLCKYTIYMNSYNLTVITNIYNEEYLLPFWLNHHKKFFDHGIIVDYGSTDRSIELCKAICPKWEIRKTRNLNFGAINADNELMDIEKTVEGIKIILTTTEFLFCDKPVNEVFNNLNISLSVKSYGPYIKKNIYPKKLSELIISLLDDSVVYIHEKSRGTRQLHTFKHGNYTVGRHYTKNITYPTDDFHIIWLGNFPFNEYIMKRKLEVKTKIPDSDVKVGFSYHHFFSEKQMLDIIYKNCEKGIHLRELNPILYRLLKSYKN